MKLTIVMPLLKKYGKCPDCGNVKIGRGEGTLVIENGFARTCKCGFKIELDINGVRAAS